MSAGTASSSRSPTPRSTRSGAYFADRHPELMDDVVRQAQRIEEAGAERYAQQEGVSLEAALQTLITGLAVRYYRAVAGSS